MNKVRRKLIAQIPRNVASLVLEVNSVPGFLNDIGITAGWTDAGILIHGKTRENENLDDHFRGGIFRSYSRYLRIARDVSKYFSARGIKVNVVDSKKDGTYVFWLDRGADLG